MVDTKLRIQEIQLTQEEILSLVAKVENWNVIGRWKGKGCFNRYAGSIGDLTLELSNHLMFCGNPGYTLDVKRDNSLLGCIYDKVYSTPQLSELYRTMECKQQEIRVYQEKLEEVLRSVEKKNRELAEKERKIKEEELNRKEETKNINYARSLLGTQPSLQSHTLDTQPSAPNWYQRISKRLTHFLTKQTTA